VLLGIHVLTHLRDVLAPLLLDVVPRIGNLRLLVVRGRAELFGLGLRLRPCLLGRTFDVGLRLRLRQRGAVLRLLGALRQLLQLFGGVHEPVRRGHTRPSLVGGIERTILVFA